MVILACVLPALEIGDTAYIGAGETQRTFVFDRSLSFAGYLRPGSLVFLAAGLLLALAGAFGVVRGTRAPLVVLACAVTLIASAQALRVSDELQWTEFDSGVAGCGRADEQQTVDECAPFLASAIRELKSDILAMPIARDPEFGLLGDADAYRARELTPFRLLRFAVFLLAPWSSYRLLRLGIRRPLVALAIVVAGLLLVFVWLALRALEGLA